MESASAHVSTRIVSPAEGNEFGTVVCENTHDNRQVRVLVQCRSRNAAADWHVMGNRELMLEPGEVATLGASGRSCACGSRTEYGYGILSAVFL